MNRGRQPRLLTNLRSLGHCLQRAATKRGGETKNNKDRRTVGIKTPEARSLCNPDLKAGSRVVWLVGPAPMLTKGVSGRRRRYGPGGPRQHFRCVPARGIRRASQHFPDSISLPFLGIGAVGNLDVQSWNRGARHSVCWIKR